jgi:peptide alpha-N-acetyltransferase
LKFEDNILGQPYYGRAAEGIIGIYLHLYDNPSIFKEDEEPDYSKMSAVERKKAKAVARKKKKAAEKKAAEEAERKKKKEEEEASEDGKKKKQSGLPVIVDEDPDGLELLKKDPLEEAKHYSAILSINAPKRVSTWIRQYDVAIRRGKGLLALQVRCGFTNFQILWERQRERFRWLTLTSSF